MDRASSLIRNCTDAEVRLLEKRAKWEIWRVNSLSMVNAMLMGVVVGIGAYAPRYRHHPLTRFLFQGAAALFMPIVSYVVSDSTFVTFLIQPITTTATCRWLLHTFCILQWTVLVQIAAINTITLVATDARELGRSIAPSALLIIHAIWTCYLVIYFLGTDLGSGNDFSVKTISQDMSDFRRIFVLVSACLMFVKLVFKLVAFFMARQSFALGRNPRLVLGYMKEKEKDVVLPSVMHVTGDDVPPPPLLVMGEDTVNVQKGPNSYTSVVDNNLQQRGAAGLVNLDEVWQQMDDEYTNYSLTSWTPAGHKQLKDVCLSFALFKLLRCRFARYTADELKFTWVENFIWQGLLLTSSTHDGGSSSSRRVFKVIADELSFIHDYYYASIPTFYSNTCWLPILTFSTSVFTLAYSLRLAVLSTTLACVNFSNSFQLWCTMPCKDVGARDFLGHFKRFEDYYTFGSLTFDLVPAILLCVLLVLSEARNIASLLFSNWTKVVVICRYLQPTNHHHQTTSSSPAAPPVDMPRRRRRRSSLVIGC